MVSGDLEQAAYPWATLPKCKCYTAMIVFIMRINTHLSVLFHKEMHDLLLQKHVVSSSVQATVTCYLKLILWSKACCCRKARCYQVHLDSASIKDCYLPFSVGLPQALSQCQYSGQVSAL